MNRRSIKGRNYVALVRCSSKGQIDTSLDAQAVLIEQYGREHGMTCVGTVELPGVTGSLPSIRTDIDEVIARKREHDDFDVLVLHDASRFTRAGVDHGMKLLFDLRRADIQTVFVTNKVPDGPMGDIMLSLLFYAANDQARSIAQGATRGAVMSIAERRRAYCLRPPYGVDRMYVDESGTPKFIIRAEPDGTQTKLTPDGNTVLERFGRNQASATLNHYIKQKSERIVLVPGDPQRVAVVREVFRQYFIEGWGYNRIARMLNDRGTPSPTGKLWSQQIVRTILLNPIYRGEGLTNLRSVGMYFERGKDRPLEVEQSNDLTDGGKPRRRIRDRQHWLTVPEERLADLLDPATAAAACAKQHAYFDRLASREAQPRNRDRHRQSAFLLKDILTVAGGLKMTGKRQGRHGEYRYYSVSRAVNVPRTSDQRLRRLIPAEPLETAVLGFLRHLLLATPDLEARVGRVVEGRAAARWAGDRQRANLETEKATLQRKLGIMIDELDEVGREVLRDKLRQAQARLRQIDKEIAAASATDEQSRDPAEIAARVMEQLRAVGQRLGGLPPHATRNVLRAMIARLEYDVETDEVELELALPAWAGFEIAAMGLDASATCKPCIETHRVLTLRYRLQMLTPRWGMRIWWVCDEELWLLAG